ncbi:MAG TPA: J domain-containing protein [Candidatus Xenobia bacterium]
MTDPRAILGVDLQADDAHIRQAYLNKVRQYPPDRCPTEFEKIRDAYEALRDPHQRIRFLLASEGPDRPLVDLLDGVVAPRPYLGPEPWLAALRGNR